MYIYVYAQCKYAHSPHVYKLPRTSAECTEPSWCGWGPGERWGHSGKVWDRGFRKPIGVGQALPPSERLKKRADCAGLAGGPRVGTGSSHRTLAASRSQRQDSRACLGSSVPGAYLSPVPTSHSRPEQKGWEGGEHSRPVVMPTAVTGQV